MYVSPSAVAAAGCENPNVIEIADCCIKGLNLKAEYEVSLGADSSCSSSGAYCMPCSVALLRLYLWPPAAEVVPQGVVGQGPRARAAEELRRQPLQPGCPRP